MTTTTQDLARQLAEHPRWTWMRGMRVLVDDLNGVVSHVSKWNGDHLVWFHQLDAGYITRRRRADCIPDLADPATQGCLWAMLRESDEGATAHCDRSEPQPWIVTGADPNDPFVFGATLGEALARAVLAAWGER